MIVPGTGLEYTSGAGTSGEFQVRFNDGGAGLNANLSGGTGVSFDFGSINGSVTVGFIITDDSGNYLLLKNH